MPKHIEDIITQEKKRSIRDVPMPENRRKGIADRRAAPRPVVDIARERKGDFPARVERVEEKEEIEESVPVPPKPRHYRDMTPSRRRKFPIRKIIVGVVIALVLIFVASISLFNGATLSYTPKSTTALFNSEVYTAEKSSTGGLVFSVVKLSGDKGTSVAASGEEKVERKASGTIVVFNNASKDPQRLIENTRFESSDGKVYRIQQAITIPGQKTVGGATQPGSVEVMVYADQPGESYNAPLTDFTLPGLKGSARYETIYARSKTPMTGGFVGTAKKVSEEGLASAKVTLQESLKEDLAEQAKAQVPDDFILYPELSTYTFEELPQSDSSDSSVTVNVRGNFYGVMFKKSDLATFLASQKVSLSPGEMVGIPTIDTLDVAFAEAAPADLLSTNEISFKVSGDVVLVWTTEESALKEDLVGRRKDEISAILDNYPSITTAEATIRPFWKSSFPDDVSDISIKQISVQ